MKQPHATTEPKKSVSRTYQRPARGNAHLHIRIAPYRPDRPARNAARFLNRLCHRKWLMPFSLKFQRNNQQNALGRVVNYIIY